jgi:hypothetical protein
VTRFFPGSPLANALGLILALIASTAAGAAFHRYVELRFSVGAARSPVNQGAAATAR